MSIHHLFFPNYNIFSGFENIIAEQQNILVNSGSNNSYEKYLEFILDKFGSHLKSAFEDHYIYSRAYYRDESNNFKVHPITTDLDKYSQIFDEGIKEAENVVINSKDAKLGKSFYYMLVNRDLLGSAFHFGNLHLDFKWVKEELERVLSPDFNIPKLIYFSFENVDCSALFSELDKAKTINDNNKIEDISQVYKIHKKTADKVKKEGLNQFYCYLLRGRNLEDQFNTSLYLVLKRPLFVGEYQQIADYFTYIMQASIKYYFKPKVQQEEWQKLFYLQSHVAQHELNIVQNSIHEMDAYQYQDDKFELYKERATKNIDELFLRNKMILYMTWYGSLDEDQKGTIISKLKNEKNEKFGKISVKAILLECIETTRLSLNLIIPRHEKIKKIETECIPTLLKCIDSLPDYEVDVMETALKVLFIERLKNAFYHTCDTNPVVTIKIDTKASEIHFTNNKTMDHDAFNGFNNHKFSNIAANEKRNAAGEKLQRFILASPFFSQSANWSIHATADSIDLNKKITDIYFSIKTIHNYV